MGDADVIAKKERAIRYCKAVSEWERQTDISSGSTFLFRQERYTAILLLGSWRKGL